MKQHRKSCRWQRRSPQSRVSFTCIGSLSTSQWIWWIPKRPKKETRLVWIKSKMVLRCVNHKHRKEGLILYSFHVVKVQPRLHCKHYLHLWLWSHIITYRVKCCYNFFTKSIIVFTSKLYYLPWCNIPYINDVCVKLIYIITMCDSIW